MSERYWKILSFKDFFELHNTGLFKDPYKNKNKEKVGHMVACNRDWEQKRITEEEEEMVLRHIL